MLELARTYGYINADRMLAEDLSGEQFAELRNFNQAISPPPHQQIILVLARIGAAICYRLEQNSAIKPADFIPDFMKIVQEHLDGGPKPKPLTAEQIANQWRGMGFQVEIAGAK